MLRFLCVYGCCSQATGHFCDEDSSDGFCGCGAGGFGGSVKLTLGIRRVGLWVGLDQGDGAAGVARATLGSGVWGVLVRTTVGAVRGVLGVPYRIIFPVGVWGPGARARIICGG